MDWSRAEIWLGPLCVFSLYLMQLIWSNIFWGNIFSIFVIAIAAAEAAIGPAILSSIYRNWKSTRINQNK